MSNIFTQSISPAFTKQSVSEYFIEPMFMAEDIRGAISVRTDIKGTELLNRISRPSMITKPKVNPGFNPVGTLDLTTSEITVKPMAIEFEQNGREFWGSIAQQLLASGYKEDDVEQMSNPDIWNKIILPIIAQTGQVDLIRQMFFADPVAEILDSSGNPTGSLNDDYSGYTGFLSHFHNDLASGVIPSGQHIAIGSAASAAKGTKGLEYTYGSGDTTMSVTINGVIYESTAGTPASSFINSFLQEHKATIEARSGINGVTIEANDTVLEVTSKHKGQSFEFTATSNGSGSWSADEEIAAVKESTLETDTADSTLEQMIDVMPSELMELDPVFMISRTMWRNLFKTWKNLGTEMANDIIFRGIKTPSYEGIPLIIRSDWDIWTKASFNDILPHKAVLSTAKNLLFGTDATSDSEMLESWYNQDEQMRRYRVQYKAQTAYLHKELIVLAGFSD